MARSVCSASVRTDITHGRLLSRSRLPASDGLPSVMPCSSIRVIPYQPIVTVEVSMIRRFLAITLFTTVFTVSSQAQPSLPATFQARSVHSPEGADIFVRWGGSGPAVVLLHGYAEKHGSGVHGCGGPVGY